MTTLARGQSNRDDAAIRGGLQTLASRLSLFTFHPVTGAAIDVAEASFQIFDTTSGLQTFPDTIGGKKTVRLGQVLPTGDKIAQGHYLADYTVPEDEDEGPKTIKWFFKISSTATEKEFIESFDVGPSVEGKDVPIALGTGVYCTRQEIRDEGFSDPPFTNARVDKKIIASSREIERLTGRFFEPRLLSYHFDGDDGRILFLDQPIIALASLQVFSSFAALLKGADPEEVDLTDVRVYNRHLTQGLLHPDDRDNPQIQFDSLDTFDEGGISDRDRRSVFGPLLFPKGSQNIQVTGVWGYTDPAPSSSTSELEKRYGVTPEAIREVCLKMVAKSLPILADCDVRLGGESAHRVKTLKQGRQSVTFQNREETGLTGDPDIDRVLRDFRRPGYVGAV